MQCSFATPHPLPALPCPPLPHTRTNLTTTTTIPLLPPPPTGVNHRYTAAERAKLKQFQSIDYLAPSSRVYRHWLAAQPWGRYWDRWLMMALIGVAVGLVGFSLHFAVHLLAAIKYHGTR